MVLEGAGLVALLGLGLAYGQGDGAVLVFLGLVGFFGVWGGQAVDAYRRAVRQGAPPAGAVQMLGLAPIAIVALTAFWLEAGGGATPAAALERYVADWRNDRPEQAAGLFVVPVDPNELGRRWAAHDRYLAERQALLGESPTDADGNGQDSGAGVPGAPFGDLEFVAGLRRGDGGAHGHGQDRASFAIHLVRRVSVPELFLGIFPAARQEIQCVERVGEVTLRLLPGRAGGAVGAVGAVGADGLWRLESVAIPAASSRCPAPG